MHSQIKLAAASLVALSARLVAAWYIEALEDGQYYPQDQNTAWRPDGEIPGQVMFRDGAVYPFMQSSYDSPCVALEGGVNSTELPEYTGEGVPDAVGIDVPTPWKAVNLDQNDQGVSQAMWFYAYEGNLCQDGFFWSFFANQSQSLEDYRSRAAEVARSENPGPTRTLIGPAATPEDADDDGHQEDDYDDEQDNEDDAVETGTEATGIATTTAAGTGTDATTGPGATATATAAGDGNRPQVGAAGLTLVVAAAGFTFLL